LARKSFPQSRAGEQNLQTQKARREVGPLFGDGGKALHSDGAAFEQTVGTPFGNGIAEQWVGFGGGGNGIAEQRISLGGGGYCVAEQRIGLSRGSGNSIQGEQ
jgi:hypothetical protein